jgi:hypothetical protein
VSIRNGYKRDPESSNILDCLIEQVHEEQPNRKLKIADEKYK